MVIQAIHMNMQVLSPECEQEREIAAIMSDPKLVEKLGNQIVKDIQKVDGGYLIFTDLCEMKVDVTYLPPTHPELIGEPTPFALTFHDPVWFQ
jgi:hypothetical protein